MRFYHYTPRANVESIIEQGLKPAMGGEMLPFVMLTTDKYEPQVGNLAYFEVELDEQDPHVHFVNKSWVEYHSEIAPASLKAVAVPPQNNDELFAIVLEHGTDSDEYEQAFAYKAIVHESDKLQVIVKDFDKLVKLHPDTAKRVYSFDVKNTAQRDNMLWVCEHFDTYEIEYDVRVPRPKKASS